MGGRGITGEVAASQCDARTFMNEATSSMNSAMGSPTVPAAEPDAAESISNPDAKIVLLNEQIGRRSCTPRARGSSIWDACIEKVGGKSV